IHTAPNVQQSGTHLPAFFFCRYIATGESFRSLSFAFRISYSYINPTLVDFKTKADEFWTKWNFPNCILAIDGKHVRIRCPNNSGSLFFNHKDYFSTVLLAMVDANYKFVAIDVGSYGKEGDSEDCALPGTDMIVPHVILGDQAFRLHKHILRPFSQKAARGDNSKTIFNYRLSRARRVTENAFGLLSQVFRVFYQPINIAPTTVDDLIIVTCCLHNMLRDAYLEHNGKAYYQFDQEYSTVNNMRSFSGESGFINTEGVIVRDIFKDYFANIGAVPWQIIQ
ncbi:protein ANTAGONIST OF LIKE HETEROCHROMATIN PROTEIN 1-like, partial [Aphis craccivora]